MECSSKAVKRRFEEAGEGRLPEEAEELRLVEEAVGLRLEGEVEE